MRSKFNRGPARPASRFDLSLELFRVEMALPTPKSGTKRAQLLWSELHLRQLITNNQITYPRGHKHRHLLPIDNEKARPAAGSHLFREIAEIVYIGDVDGLPHLYHGGTSS
ncbi:MAG TPA: hypothetical protein VGR16_13565 [Thermomicrobiales bacterium]|nr:hypothetical protein [Thermomicrobiales bacterium]